MKIVACMGGLWRMTNASYRKFLERVASGEEWDLDRYGKHIGRIALQATDMTPEQAQDELDNL